MRYEIGLEVLGEEGIGLVLIDAVGEHSCFILVGFRERDSEDLAGFGRGRDDQELVAGF